jgi:hypothetical protein
MVVEPLKARPKLCASAADWVERNPLAGIEGLHLMNDRVEVENVDTLRALAFENRANLCLEKIQLA